MSSAGLSCPALNLHGFPFVLFEYFLLCCVQAAANGDLLPPVGRGSLSACKKPCFGFGGRVTSSIWVYAFVALISPQKRSRGLQLSEHCDSIGSHPTSGPRKQQKCFAILHACTRPGGLFERGTWLDWCPKSAWNNISTFHLTTDLTTGNSRSGSRVATPPPVRGASKSTMP